MEIVKIFPRTVALFDLELPPLDVSTIQWQGNGLNYRSTITNVLDHYPELRAMIVANLEQFRQEVLGVTGTILITESWFNRGCGHPNHYHPNSIFSGVVYLDGTGGQTTFHNGYRPQFHFSNPNYTDGQFMWKPEYKRGRMVLFPSDIEHSVEPSPEQRLTLAFNTWFQGTISTDSTTLLTL